MNNSEKKLIFDKLWITSLVVCIVLSITAAAFQTDGAIGIPLLFVPTCIMYTLRYWYRWVVRSTSFAAEKSK